MGTIFRFEDLEVWQMARQQCSDICKIINKYRVEKTLADQATRASASVMDNIAEGFNRFSRNDVVHFLIIARGSNAEVRSHYYRMQDQYKTSIKEIELLRFNSEVLGKKLNSFITYLKNCSYKSKPL
ncbi:MAG: four helix bundle protein [Chitinophagaceae bacterium]|nr:MAG: four helix bundle protein [Chitinophagaceae bacterium]